ncbi:L7Ae/L30e/S12e/Gadd45 family ribosomal protein [Dialister invisus]|uniref:L7Ae/L30e/S12e/Gadd45 family ribosomal protein n=1 Tax=Dialister TaxID=39948 RepID=UPI0039913B22
MNEPIYRLLGLCMKAGRLLSGSEQIKTAVKDGKGILLILAEDSSERTKEEYIRLAKLSGITWRIFGEKEKLGHAVGKGIRAVILISDSGFGTSLLQRIDTLK